MEYLAVAALAIVQGLTEFLPVSSSGHLVIAQRLFGWNNANVVLDAVLHLGTALAIVVVYWKDLRDLAAGLFSPDRDRRTGSLRTVAFLAIGTIPAIIAGILLRGFFERMFSNPQAVSKLFFVSAAFLLAAGLKKRLRAGAVNAPKAAVIGLAQALAILPGVSRSGTTISTGLLLGIDRREAARFSFFLALPVILGAAFLELKDGAAASIAPGLLLVGFTISFVIGIAALKILMRFIERGRLGYFAIYLIALGLICSLAF